MKKVISMALVLAMAVLGLGAAGRWTAKQTAAHEAAEILRAAGVEEESEAIQGLKGLWWDEYYGGTDDGSDISCGGGGDLGSGALDSTLDGDSGLGQDSGEVAAVETPIWELAGISWVDYCTWCNTVQHEAGPGCSPEHQKDMAAVVWNRVLSDRFPDTVVGVITQPRQYSSRYVTDSLDGVDQSCIDAVDAVLSGEWTVPEDVVWQAQFVQGRYIYATHVYSDGYYHSTTYICGGYIW